MQNLYRSSTNPQNNIFGYKNPGHSPLTGIYDRIDNTNIQSTIDNLLRKNQELQDRLNQQKSKNFDLLQLKRRMEEDLRKMQFQFDRINNHESLYEKQSTIKSYQLSTQLSKMQTELDGYLHENKYLREQIRKFNKQLGLNKKQKHTLEEQNIYLLKEIEDLKDKVRAYEKNKQNVFDDVISTKSKENSRAYISPMKDLNNHSSYVSTNEPKSSYYVKSPARLSSNRQYEETSFHRNQQQKSEKVPRIEEQFYQDYDETPIHSFQNNAIQNTINSSNNFDHNHHQNEVNKKKYSNYSQYAPVNLHNQNKRQYSQNDLIKPRNQQNKRQNIIVRQENQELKINQRQSYHVPSFNKKIQTISISDQEHKNQLEAQVSQLRTEVIKQLLNKSYRRSISDAEQHKSNALKLFMEILKPISNVMNQMSANYLEARQALLQACPTLRQKWDTPNSLENSANSQYIFKIYQSIKDNAKKQKSLAGQFLALFRLLTLLDKMDQNSVDQTLITNMQHSALKFIYKISNQIYTENTSSIIQHKKVSTKL